MNKVTTSSCSKQVKYQVSRLLLVDFPIFHVLYNIDLHVDGGTVVKKLKLIFF